MDTIKSLALGLVLAVFVGRAEAHAQGLITAPAASQYDEADEIALREYIDVRINASHDALVEGLETSKEAVEKAERATELRFQSVNEFRAQLDDQQRTFMPRLEYEQAHQALINRVDALTKNMDDLIARNQARTEIWPIMFGIVGMVGIAFGIFMSLRKPVVVEHENRRPIMIEHERVERRAQP